MEENEEKATEYFIKSAKQGNIKASEELIKLGIVASMREVESDIQNEEQILKDRKTQEYKEAIENEILAPYGGNIEEEFKEEIVKQNNEVEASNELNSDIDDEICSNFTEPRIAENISPHHSHIVIDKV